MEKGDSIVFKTKKTFLQTRMQKHTTVIESVGDNHVDCGVDGRIHKSNVVEFKGKSPRCS